MEKIKKKLLKSILLLCLPQGLLWGQAKSGLENYHQLSRGKGYLWMPILHYQSQKGLYAAFRYNYEEAGTASLFIGRSFEKTSARGMFNWTPMIGISAGTFRGGSLAMNTDVEKGRFYFSSQMQYSHSVPAGSGNFYFNWSEAGFEITGHFFTGIAAQYTIQQGRDEWQPGLLAGLTLGNFSLPVYFLRPFGKDLFVIVGLNYEYRIQKRKRR